MKKTITDFYNTMLVPKAILYYPQMWDYHPCMGSLYPAKNKRNL